MSSAILYLAIIAIWAGVLIPRWLKRDTSQARTSKSSQEFIGDGAVDADVDAGSGGAGVHMVDDDAVAEADRVSAGGVLADRDDVAEYERDGREVRMGFHPADSESRSRILAARRRLLMMLGSLTVAALGIAMVRLAAWWVAVPPIAMLGGYMMLLREASRVDAEHALIRADGAAYREEQRRHSAREASGSSGSSGRREAPGAPERREEPQTARIIDISGRVRDELYDQYADAERRAVGD